MNKRSIVGSMLLFLMLVAPLATAASPLKLRIFGGGDYLQGGDLNRGLQGWTDYWKANLNAQGYTQQTGSFNPVHLGLNVGGDVILLLSPHWGLGLGTEYIMATKSSALTFQSTTKVINWDILGKAQALPAKLSLFYFIPLTDSLTITFHAGAGYYSAKTRLGSKQESDYIIDANGTGIGYHGGIGLEIKFFTGASLFIEGAGRYATLSGFEGNVTIDGDHAWDGKLYYWEAKHTYIDNYGYIDLLMGAPGGSAFKFVRDAEIDFSGFSLRAGIAIRL